MSSYPFENAGFRHLPPCCAFLQAAGDGCNSSDAFIASVDMKRLIVPFGKTSIGRSMTYVSQKSAPSLPDLTRSSSRW